MQGSRSHTVEEFWRGVGEGVCFDGGSDKVEGVAFLLAAGFDHAQQGFDEAAAGGVVRAG